MENKINYIYTDLDGTLLNSKKNISKKTIKYFKKLQKQGIKNGIITGRSHFMVKKQVDQTNPNLPLVCMNGAIIFKDATTLNKPIYECDLDKEFSFQFLKFSLEQKIPLLIYTDSGILYNDPNKNSDHIKWTWKLRDGYPENEKWEFNQLSPESIDNIKVYKFLILIKEISSDKLDKIKRFAKNFKGIELMFSQSHLLDIVNDKVSKGAAIDFLIKNKYIIEEETMVFGDQDNDVSMFKNKTISVAMINGSELAKSEATYLSAKNNDNDGIVDFLKSFQ